MVKNGQLKNLENFKDGKSKCIKSTENGFRRGRDRVVLLEEAVKKGNISQLEADMVNRSRAYQSVERDSISAKIVLSFDPVRNTVMKCKIDIAKQLNLIRRKKQLIRKFESQLMSGEITELAHNGMKLTKEDLENEIDFEKISCWEESRNVIAQLSKIRTLVGMHDPAMKIIITLEDFDKYAEETITKLRGLGYEVLDEA
jgi:hypothetical protein